MTRLVCHGMARICCLTAVFCFSVCINAKDGPGPQRPAIIEPDTPTEITIGFLKTGVRHINVHEAQNLISTNPNLRILDVRTQGEFRKGHIANAKQVNVFSWRFKRQLKKLDTDAPWIIYCKSGHRSQWALARLKQAGMATIFHMDGGFDAWKSALLPVTAESKL